MIKKIGNYSVDTKQQLGIGSFATTYLSWLTNDPQTMFACKMINKKQITTKFNNYNNQYIIERIKIQVKTWKQIHHPHIVKFYDCQQSTNNLYFFLQLCKGGTLQKYIDNHRFDKDADKIYQFFKQLVQACLYLFRNDIIHRDIKPDNILLKDGQIKLTDFGLARTIDPQEKQKNIWTMTTVGTPIYMAPQVLNQQKYTFKCDVWSIGVTIFELLTGDLPYNVNKKDNSPIVILEKIKKNNEGFTHENFKHFQQLKTIIMPMIEKQPDKRPSIEQVSKMVENLKKR